MVSTYSDSNLKIDVIRVPYKYVKRPMRPMRPNLFRGIVEFLICYSSLNS
jgi:hypothetical protein